MREWYWSANDLLSKGAMFNFAIGGRGTGKTFDAKYRLIKRAIKKDRRFIYLRRYDSEFEDREKFFSDVKKKFPGYEFQVIGNTGYVRKDLRDQNDKPVYKWKPCVYFVRLATTIGKKGVPYDDVDYIVFDEFIIDKGSLHYLQNEVKTFLDFYNTVDRFNDRVKVLFLANSVSIMNPYFLAWHLNPRRGKRFIRASKNYICVEYIDSEQYREHVDSTRFGQFIKGTDYYDYAVSNQFHDDNDQFIEKKTSLAKFYFAFKFDDTTMGVWVDYTTGMYYISKKYPPNTLIYALTKDDMRPNLVMVERSGYLMKSLRQMYMLGNVRFENSKMRQYFIDVLDYLNVR